MTVDRPQVLSVSELNATARLLLEEAFRLVWIEGEISNLRIPASGHWYFTLKDARAQVRCVLFKGRQRFVRMVPRDGAQVRIQGAISLYEERGEFQILAERMELAGDGALKRAREQLRLALAAEGLFADARKRPLPAAPQHLALVTSASGAALQDMLKVLRQRCPLLRVTLLPVAVQGDGAAPGIAGALMAIATLPATHGVPPVDVVILGRGGGSSEDLHAFDDERVVRAVAACAAPVISAVGHETDVSLTDFVADARAPTPTAAAAMAVPDLGLLARQFRQQAATRAETWRRTLHARGTELAALRARLRHPGRRLDDLAQLLDEREQRLHRAARSVLRLAGQRLDATAGRLRPPHDRLRRAAEASGLLAARLQAALQRRLDDEAARVTALHGALLPAMNDQLSTARQRLALEARALAAVSPLATLDRGYAVLRTAETPARVIHRIADATPGQQVNVLVRDGEVACEVVGVRPRDLAP
jgi:exodeoxyribonuclease VII large subunit